MSDLKIKVNIGPFNVELEGASSDVISQFEEIKKNGLGEIVNQLLTAKQTVESTSTIQNQLMTQPPLLEGTATDDSISLQNVVYKMLPKSEREWVLVYAYFLDREGKSRFTRADILNKYDESNRKTDVRVKNLSASIGGAVRKTWINAINDSEFIITSIGKKVALEVLSRTEGTAKPPKKRLQRDESSGQVTDEQTV